MQAFTILALFTAVATAETYNGVATYYTQDGVAGSCGQYHSDSDYIVAVSAQFPSNSYCGRTVTITNTGGGYENYGEGTTIQATVADTCEGCDEAHLDLAEGPFEALTGGNLDPPGTFNIQWYFD